MQILTALDIAAIVLVGIHFGVPLTYYWYLKRKWLLKPWNIKLDPNYKPKITVIIPTYNEVKLIEKKMDNIYGQEYPKDKLEVIIIDSASTDGTLEKVRQWIEQHANPTNFKLIQEPERKGKAHALNTALKYVTGKVVIITDVDSWWPGDNTLMETIKWLADPKIGAVSCLKRPANPGKTRIEESYRQYYNILRIAESKVWSTPIFHGELAAFKADLLNKLGGFPTDIGADDSYVATRIALMGLRAIIPETIWCIEDVPKGIDYHSWRIRRAQHLIQHFLKIIKLLKNSPNKKLRTVLTVEIYLHLVNPWLLLIGLIILIMETLSGFIFSLTVLIIGLLALALKSFRTWVITQMYLIISMVKNIYTKELIWKKQSKESNIMTIKK